ncbi:MAG: mannose-1-phosphate guanylyltransferase [Spirochaetota bacterium]|nr:MAG: mannose-1-phosphate guanylyltransferase [Spirochaetota bacterium]
MDHIVIMAGGKGERFWPRSTKALPKQFQRIVSDRTMIQETFNRVYPEYDKEHISVVLGESLVPCLQEQLPILERRSIIVEPIGRNTAAAIGLAAVHIKKEDPEAVMIVLTADHVIKPKAAFLAVLEAASDIARKGHIVTFGIIPERAATEYGYIELGKKLEKSHGLGVFIVKKFTEKPDEKTARSFVQSGYYLWNSGMFAFRVQDMLNAMEQHMPALYSSLKAIGESIGRKDEDKVKRNQFESIENISIDYGIMERVSNIACIKTNFYWDDIGSWSSIARHRKQEKEGNITEGNVVVIDSKNNIVLGDREEVISIIGVHDLVIVKQDNKLLICNKSSDQNIKEALKLMSQDRKLSRYL